jgi:3'-phosphoadenosine 5'-phosphosulfate sulfotransferase (PAPS reductase)/FAD synthetase
MPHPNLTPEQRRAVLRQRQSLPLEAKVRMSLKRIREWYEHWDGDVFGSYSGGKDSIVLRDLIWSCWPDVPMVCSNTGLEYPELMAGVLELKAEYPDRVIVIRPKCTFRQVVQEEGFPVVSKKVSRQLRILREHKDDPAWANTYRLYDTGIRQDGVFVKQSRLPAKWRKLINAPFKISELCCDRLKKEPLDSYARESGRKRITGMMAGEGGQRASVGREQCNLYDAAMPSSAPMWFWNEEDSWQYIREHNLTYPSVYDHGERRTGCMFCAFGAHLEKEPNRFQRMRMSHPKQWAYCMDNLGMRDVLGVVGVKCD